MNWLFFLLNFLLILISAFFEVMAIAIAGSSHTINGRDDAELMIFVIPSCYVILQIALIVLFVFNKRSKEKIGFLE